MLSIIVRVCFVRARLCVSVAGRPSVFFFSLKEDEEYEEPERGFAIRPSRMGLKNVPGMED